MTSKTMRQGRVRAGAGALALLVLAVEARAVDPAFKVYLDEYPLVPLERVVFAWDAGPAPFSTVMGPSITNATQLEAQGSWDFSGITGEGVVIQVAPVAAGWSCYVPDNVRNDCGFELPGNDVLLVRDNLVTGSRGATALDWNGGTTILERAQSITEGATDETRLCFNPAYYPDVPFLVFQGSDVRGPYISGSDPAWSSPVFSCDSDLNTVTQGGRCGTSAGTGGGFDDGNGTPGRALARVVRAGTMTLPSGHVLDAVLVEALASFNVRVGCFVSGARVRLYQLFWYVPHHGALVQMSSGDDVASLDAWTDVVSTSVGFGLLPPLSIQVDATTSSSVTVSWDPGRVTSFIDEFVVHWGTQPGSVVPPTESSESRGDTIPASQTSYTITGLSGGATYYVSVSTKRSYTDPKTSVTTVYRSIELPKSVGADVDGDGVLDTSYPPEVAATTSAGAEELLVNRQIRLTPGGPVPTLASQFSCTGLCADERVPGSLPMTLAGEATPSGQASLRLYWHSSGTPTMTVSRNGADLEFGP